MKTILSLIFAFCFTLTVSAQNELKSVNVDNVRFPFKERKMPRKPFNPPFFYYSPQVILHPSLKGIIAQQTLAERLFILDQRKAKQERDADMLVKITMQPIEIIDFKIGQRIDEYKDSRGEVVRTRVYWPEISYSFAATADIVNRRVNAVTSTYDIQSRKEVRTFISREFDDLRAAENYWAYNRALAMEEIIRNETVQAMDRLNAMLEKDFSFPIYNNSGLIKTINEKKHPENTALRRKSTSLVGILTKLDGNRALTVERVQPELEYFLNIPLRYTTDSKPDVRLRYVAYYNICRIYLFLEMPEKVEKWADLLFENGFDTKDRDRLVKDAETLRKTLSEGIGTYQFDPQDYFDR